jgi:4-amino-4-deoxy-L-arabinose transferase-like glycosyltransferase
MGRLCASIIAAMPKTRIARETWLFWLLAALVLAAGLGLRDPWPADEPRFALVAKQMVESGDWLFPHRGAELYSDKPPLFMWTQAASYLLVRDWRVAFLLPSLLAALGTLWCVVDLGRRLWTKRVGLYAGYAVLFALQFTYQAKKAQIDPLLTFLVTLGNYAFLRFHLRMRGDAARADWRWWLLGWFAAGLGTVTKGVGVLALAMIVPGAWAAARGWHAARAPLRDWRVLLGPLAFVVAAALWLAPMLLVALHGDDPAYRAYVHDILFRQTAERYASSWAHRQPPWYFIEIMATLWLPALLALPWALPAWRRRLRRRDARYLLPLAWWVLVLAFFSLPAGKRDMYILPALPMACLALAPLLPGIVRRRGARRLAFAFAILLAAVLAGAGAALLLPDGALAARLALERGLAAAQLRAAGWMLLAMGAGVAVAMAWSGARRAHMGVIAGLASTWILFGLVAYPLLDASSSSRDLMHEARTRIGPAAELGLVAWKEQNLLMAEGPTRTFGFRRAPADQLRDAAAWQAEAPASRWLMAQDTALLPCVERSRAIALGAANRRDWSLLPAAATARCAAAASPAVRDGAAPTGDVR